MKRYRTFVNQMFNIVKMSIDILLNLIYRFNTVSIKTMSGLFVVTDKMILKFIWKIKAPRIAKQILKKNKFGGFYYLISRCITV